VVVEVRGWCLFIELLISEARIDMVRLCIVSLFSLNFRGFTYTRPPYGGQLRYQQGSIILKACEKD
jgi:hypothetical protein